MSGTPKQISRLKDLSLRTQFSQIQEICTRSIKLPLLPRRELFFLPVIEMILKEQDDDTFEAGLWLLCDTVRSNEEDLYFLLENSLIDDGIAQLTIGVLSRCICVMLKSMDEHDEEIDEYTIFLSEESENTIRELTDSSNVGVKLSAAALLLRAQNRDEMQYIQLPDTEKLTHQHLSQVRDPFMRRGLTTLFPPNPQLLPSVMTLAHPDPFFRYRAVKLLLSAGDCADSILSEAFQSEVDEVAQHAVLGFGAFRELARAALRRRPDFAEFIAHWMASDHGMIRHAAIFATHQLEDSLLDASPKISQAYAQAISVGAISALPARMFLQDHDQYFTRAGIDVASLIQRLIESEEQEKRSQPL